MHGKSHAKSHKTATNNEDTRAIRCHTLLSNHLRCKDREESARCPVRKEMHARYDGARVSCTHETLASLAVYHVKA